jgi:competence protein ComEC
MEWLRQLRLKRTGLVFVLCLALLIGVGLAHSGQLLDGSWWVLAAAGLLFTIRKRTIWTVFWVVLLGVTLGWWRGSVYMLKLAEYNHYFYHKVTISAVATDDATYDKYKQLSFDANDLHIVSTNQALTGKIQLSGFGATAVYAGDQVNVTGKLYPARGSNQSRMSYGTITIVKHSTSWVADLRRKFVAGMQSALPDNLASFGMGLLIGQKANLPDQIYNALLMVGLVHIIAVSGYNLTIILRASNGMLKKRSKRLSTLLALSLIAIFLLFAGTSASIVRAAIVSVLSIGTAYYGRKVKPLVLILLAAAITAWMSPFYVWTDVSWYLSFLAFFGVMVVAPMVMKRLPWRLQSSLIATVAVESLCAELMTLPYVLYVFGQMSFIGLLANVMVVALVPLAMLLCMVAGLAGMLLPAIAGWFAWPARLLLTYMLDIANLLSRIPHIFVQGIGLPLSELLVLYAIVASAVYVLWRKTRKIATITDEIDS